MAKTNLKALPLVASMLGDKLGVKVIIGERKTACTDGGTIYLPSLPINAPEQLVGLVNGYLDHEAAHIRHTDFGTLNQTPMSNLERYACNVIEDWRVETTIIKRYPGCQAHFDWLIRHLFLNNSEDENKAGESNPPAFVILDYLLLSVRSWSVPELQTISDQYADSVKASWPGLVEQLDDLLVEVQKDCHTTSDSINYAKKFASIIKQYVQNYGKKRIPQEDKNSPNNSSVLPYSETSESNNSNQTSTIHKEEFTDPDEQKQQLKNLLKVKKGELPQGFDAQVSQAIGGMKDGTSHEVGVATEAQIQTSPLSDHLITEALSSSRAMRTKLQALLQSKVLRRTCPSHHGKVSGRLLHRLSIKNPMMFRKNEEVTGTDTGVHILLDISGSMQRRIDLASSACYSVATALSGISGLSVAISVFPADHTTDQPTVCPLVRYGERVTSKLSVHTGGSTPLTEALWWVVKQLIPQSEPRKIILVITDGSPDDYQTAQNTIQAVLGMGIEILGIGIAAPTLSHLISNQENISTMTELAPAMFRILQRTLLTPRG